MMRMTMMMVYDDALSYAVIRGVISDDRYFTGRSWRQRQRTLQVSSHECTRIRRERSIYINVFYIDVSIYLCTLSINSSIYRYVLLSTLCDSLWSLFLLMMMMMMIDWLVASISWWISVDVIVFAIHTHLLGEPGAERWLQIELKLIADVGKWGWMDGWVSEDRWMDGWMHACMHGWIYYLLDGWMDRWMDTWMDGWLVGWMDRYIDR